MILVIILHIDVLVTGGVLGHGSPSLTLVQHIAESHSKVYGSGMEYLT